MENAFLAQVLRERGYNTFWVGKNHNVPSEAWAMGGSKAEWPIARGFDRFYGFLGGETNQWYPDLVEDNHYVEQPYLPEDGYHLSKDLADNAISFIADSRQSRPTSPGT
jgi:arylsulfatase